MNKVHLAWKPLLLKHLESGKPLREVLTLMRIGMDKLIQEKHADPEFAEELAQYEHRASRRPSW